MEENNLQPNPQSPYFHAMPWQNSTYLWYEIKLSYPCIPEENKVSRMNKEIIEKTVQNLETRITERRILNCNLLTF